MSTNAAYAEPIALVRRSDLKATDLIPEQDLKDLRAEFLIYSENPNMDNVLSIVKTEYFEKKDDKGEMQPLKNKFYLKPEALEKKALLKFKADYEAMKQRADPQMQHMLRQAEEEYRRSGAGNSAAKGTGDEKYQRMKMMGLVPEEQSYEEWAMYNNPAGMAARGSSDAARAKLEQLVLMALGHPYNPTFQEVILRKNVLSL